MTIPKQLLEAKICNKDTCEEIRKLKKENNDLKRIYKNTYEKLFKNGNEELAHYFMAQIDDCPTFYVEPIIDYYKEYYKQENDIKILLKENEAKEKVIIKYDNVLNELEKWLEENDEVSNISFEMGRHFNYKDVINKIYELKESDK